MSLTKITSTIDNTEQNTVNNEKGNNESLYNNTSNIDIIESTTHSDEKEDIPSIDEGSSIIDNTQRKINSDLKENTQNMSKSNSNIHNTEIITNRDVKENTKNIDKTSTNIEEQDKTTINTTNIYENTPKNNSDLKDETEQLINDTNKNTQHNIISSYNDKSTSVITTYHKDNIQLTTPAIKITEEITHYNKAWVILTSISQLIIYPSNFCFYIRFLNVKGFILTPRLKIYIEIMFIRLLRVLQNQEAICEKFNDSSENAIYLCEVQETITSSHIIKVLPVFYFEQQDVEILGISPLANVAINNLQNATNEFNNTNLTLYLLDKSIIQTKDKSLLFNITGIIKDPQPKFGKVDLVLKINVENEMNKFEDEIKCSIINIFNSNYTLNCEGKEGFLYDLEAAISFIGNEILIINFDDNINRKIKFNSLRSNLYFKNKNSKNGISPAAIVAIIIVSIFVIGLLILIHIYLRKIRNEKQKKDIIESSIINFNNKV